ncbi:hypothetical protein M758_10G041300 [Ceratodon purpureus]|uniref:Uncharacterized protein n=1 Tax=Ceratodon purpureus TaxID=3225 RepID=A0A8T0GI29_CERPU|nr:hypothetical protein KC19_10G044400 [Ceratodon purpureus]KAG0602793.1 hypothetical protein M758_10G041300 [Ceratodon purpureus]
MCHEKYGICTSLIFSRCIATCFLVTNTARSTTLGFEHVQAYLYGSQHSETSVVCDFTTEIITLVGHVPKVSTFSEKLLSNDGRVMHLLLFPIIRDLRTFAHDGISLQKIPGSQSCLYT